MFHLDLTMEDTRLVISSQTGEKYSGYVLDGMTGNSLTLSLSAEELAATLTLALPMKGESVNPETTAALYAIAEPMHEREALTGPFRLIP